MGVTSEPNLAEHGENGRLPWLLGFLWPQLWLLLRVKFQSQGGLLRAVRNPVLLIWGKREGGVMPVHLTEEGRFSAMKTGDPPSAQGSGKED